MSIQGAVSASQQRRALQQYTARCHVHDICQVLIASMHQPSPGSIYNVVDDNPASRAEVMAFAAKLLELPSDTASIDDDRQASAAAQAAIVETAITSASIHGKVTRKPDSQRTEKRVSNKKVKAELCVTLDFPSYVEGLSAIHHGDKRPFV